MINHLQAAAARWLPVLGLAAVIGCAQSQPMPAPVALPTGASVIISTTDSAAHLYRDEHQRLAEPLRVVVSDSVVLDSLWRRMALGRLPAIDFKRSQVIVAILGAETVGPTISIDTVASYADERLVVVQRTYPPARCLQAQETVIPADIVLVPRDTVRHVRFVERLKTLQDCYR
jgi:hypothetical protein